MATDAERDHMINTKLYVGCLPCLIGGWPNVHADYHHAEAGRKRKAHTHGFAMCVYHHRGERSAELSQYTMDDLELFFGPSFQRNKRRFIDIYGPESLLVDLNNFAMLRWKQVGWLEHEMPSSVQSEVQRQHQRLVHDA